MDVHSVSITPSQLEAILSGHIEMSPGECSCAHQEEGVDYTPHVFDAIGKGMRGAVLVPAERVLFPLLSATKVMNAVMRTDTVGEWFFTHKSKNGVPLRELTDWVAGEYYVHELHLPHIQELASRDSRDVNSHSVLKNAVGALSSHMSVDMAWDSQGNKELFYCACDPDHVIPLSDTELELHRAQAIRDAGAFLMSIKETSEYAENFGKMIPALGMVLIHILQYRSIKYQKHGRLYQ